MALFGGKDKKQEGQEARDQIMKILSQHENLTFLIEQILIESGKTPYKDENGEAKTQEGNEWLTECQSYYDSRRRRVIVEADLFEIKWSDISKEKRQGPNGNVYYETVETIYKRIEYRYTGIGYKPLSQVRCGGFPLELPEVLSCWANVIKEKMQGAFPELEFNRVVSGQNEENGQPRAVFDYVVPELEWKDWFEN